MKFEYFRFDDFEDEEGNKEKFNKMALSFYFDKDRSPTDNTEAFTYKYIPKPKRKRKLFYKFVRKIKK